jgi:hypothetical protein
MKNARSKGCSRFPKWGPTFRGSILCPHVSIWKNRTSRYPFQQTGLPDLHFSQPDFQISKSEFRTSRVPHSSSGPVPFLESQLKYARAWGPIVQNWISIRPVPNANKVWIWISDGQIITILATWRVSGGYILPISRLICGTCSAMFVSPIYLEHDIQASTT